MMRTEHMPLADVRLATEIPVWQIGLLAIVAAVAVCWWYARESATLATPWRFLLPGLRTTAVVLVVLLLAQPIWHRKEVIGTLGRVVFAIDVSGSMSHHDASQASGRPARWRRALEHLTGAASADDEDALDRAWLRRMADTHQVDVVAFSDTSPQFIWSDTAIRDERTTDRLSRLDVDVAELVGGPTRYQPLMAAMASLRRPETADARPESTLRAADEDQQAAVVILSDGRAVNSSTSVEDAERLKAAGIRVFAVGYGATDEPVDVGIADVDVPETVASDGQLTGRLQLKTVGLRGRTTKLRIEAEGKTVWDSEVVSAGDGLRPVAFQIDVSDVLERIADNSTPDVAKQATVLELHAFAETDSETDAIAENDALDFRVSAVDRDRRLLILDGSSRWETRYVRNLFDRDPAWQVDTLLFGPGTDRAKIVRGEQPGQLPVSHEAYAKYDAVLLGEIPPDQWNDQDGERLKHYVARGGGLILLDGKLGRMKQLVEKTLTDLVPVTFSKPDFAVRNLQPADQEPVPLSSAVDLRAIRPTLAAGDLPLFHLTGDQSESAALWPRLPPPTRVNVVQRSADAETWAVAETIHGEPLPWLVTRLFGSGRVVYLASDQTWRWRYKVADRFHSRFWNQLLAAVMPMSFSAIDNFVSIGTNRIHYGPAESVEIHAKLRDERGRPKSDATVDAVLWQDGAIRRIVPMSIDDTARGTYVGQAGDLPLGRYEVRIRASGYAAESLKASTPIWVRRPASEEWSRISLDASQLRSIASAGGGEYFHESEADRLLESLRPLSNGTIVETDDPLWQSWPWFLAVVLILAMEWIIRKRVGLI